MQNNRDEEKEVKDQAESKPSPLPKIIIGIVLLGLIAGGAAAGYFFLMAPKLKSSGGAPQASQSTSNEQGTAGGSHPGGSIKPLDPFIVNLTDGQGTRYLKAVIQLEMDNEMLSGEIDKKMPQIRDEIIMLLSSKSFDDLSSTPGKRALKRGMVESVNKYLASGKVVNVFFSDFVIQ